MTNGPIVMIEPLFLEPPIGLEPTTCGLRNRRDTIEKACLNSDRVSLRTLLRTLSGTVRLVARCRLTHSRPMRLDAKVHEGQGARNHHGAVHRVLRNGHEHSAWSEPDEAQRALKAALEEEAATERARLPANAQQGLRVDATSLLYEIGGTVFWKTDYALDHVRGPRGFLVN